jgi:hypothetical protein
MKVFTLYMDEKKASHRSFEVWPAGSAATFPLPPLPQNPKTSESERRDEREEESVQ